MKGINYMKKLKKIAQRNSLHTAFTMIELVFVIVVLGILAAIAVPKFAATRTDAQISKARSDISAIRSAIVSERQTRLIKGDSSYINQLHSSASAYFDNNGTADNSLLMYAVVPKNANGHWETGASCTGNAGSKVCTYTFKISDENITFTYKQADGTFDCVHTNDMCKKLTE